ncbi:PRC-barrel domain-containing protein [Paracoccus sp. (in: a-proteobacteria)]|uniref:PRC-barrel domain-containing protein n=1 Tax=Paracoccus sp. TaxID=267 RepID=UPI00289B857F|nr:PRC-barrel domain-containing protein [Paracoccus sp. (in: a-proteobacteria)]
MKDRILYPLIATVMLGSTAFAQSTSETPATTPPAEAEPSGAVVTPDPAPTAPDASTDTAMTPMGTPADVVISVPEGYVLTEVATMTGDQLKGVDIYDSSDKKIAEIADVVIGPDNSVTGIVTDVGGFLGMGEHRVSLAPDKVSVYKNADNEMRAYVSMTKDELKALPTYEAPNQ